MLVAECPRRVQLLCEKLFDVDKPSTSFAYVDDMNERDTLQRMSCVESLPDHIQPRVPSRKQSWRIPYASAPNKSRDKPDSRRPLIDRSQCPTACLDCPGPRAVDWISTVFLPWHLHIDLHRTDQFVPLLREFVERAPLGLIHSVGTDVDACFTNMPHELVWAAWHSARECMPLQATSHQ